MFQNFAQSRYGTLAAININTATAFNWGTNFGPNNYFTIRDIEKIGSKLFVLGDFRAINGVSYNGYVSISTNDTGRILPWNPAPVGNNNPIHDLEVEGNILWAIGTFTSIGGQNYATIAKINSTTGLALPWQTTVDFRSGGALKFNRILKAGNNLYVCGQFEKVNNSDQVAFAVIDASNGNLIHFDPVLGGHDITAYVYVNCIGSYGNKLFLGGSFASVNMVPRSYFAAIGIGSGKVTPLNANVNEIVYAIEQTGSNLILGGDFDKVGNISRMGLCMINASNGQLSPWNPNAAVQSITGCNVRCMAIEGDTLFVGGYIKALGSQNRSGGGALSISTGNIFNWDPLISSSSNPVINRILKKGNKLFFCGLFESVAGIPHKNLAVYDLRNGNSSGLNIPLGSITVRGWNKGTWVNDLILDGNYLYIAGLFDSVGLKPIRNFARINLLNYQVDNTFSPNPSDWVRAIGKIPNQNQIIIAGQFDTIYGQVREGLASVDISNGLLTAWNPRLFGLARKVIPNANQVFVGGEFYGIGTQVATNFASLSLNTGSITNNKPAEPYNTVKQNVYPNPASTYIKVDAGFSGQTFKIINSIGKVIQEGSLNNNLIIDISSIEKGIYILSIFNMPIQFVKE